MKEKNIIKASVEIFCQLSIFVLVQYILACFYLSFKNNILSIIFMVCNTGVLIQTWEYLSRVVESKVIKSIVLFAGVIIVGGILLLYGYFPVSTTLQEVLL